MGFFENLTQSVSKAAKQASDSAKTLADKSRVKKGIADLENEIRSRFCEIGEKFFKENPTPTPEYEELFKAITDLRAALAEKEKELQALEGTTSCPSCGKTVPRDVKFCSFCGYTMPALDQPAAAAQSVCPVCGVPLAGDAAFCASCGNRVTPGAPAAPAAPAPAAPAAPAQVFCPNCGEALAPDATFCPGCGNKAPGID